MTWRNPSPTGYGALERLERSGLVSAGDEEFVDGRARHCYRLTKSRGEEVLAGLSEAYPGRSRPALRETVALVRAGVQLRFRSAVDDTAQPWWLDGIHLSALVLAAPALVPYLQDVWHWALCIAPGRNALAFRFSGWYP